MSEVKKRGRGQPSPLDESLLAELLLAAERCLFVDTLAALAGVALNTMRGWLREGRKALRNGGELTDHQELCVRLLDGVKKSWAEAESKAIQQIRTHAEANFNACAWLLDRRYPEKYGSNRREILEMKKAIRELEARLGVDKGDPVE